MEKKKNDATVLMDSIFGRCKEGFIEIRLIPKNRDPKKVKQLFIPISKRKEIPNILSTYKEHIEREQCGCHFAPATHIENDGTKNGILHVPVVWVDVDMYKLSEEEKAEIRSRYAEFKLKASFIVSSGRGLHIYWLLKTPASREDLPKVKNILKRLALFLHGDNSATDVTHLLRILGTLNYKTQEPIEVKFNDCDPAREYDLSNFENILPEIEETSNGKEPPKPEGWRDEILEGVPEGQRNSSLTQLAGSYVGKRLSRNEILAILEKANSQFKPPLSSKEVESILDSVIQTDKRNHPESSPSREKSTPSWPSPLAKEAFYGLAGEYVNLIQPHTESDPAAVLVQFLSAVGNIIGSTAHFKVEADKHSLKINPVLVGKTSKGRKGTSTGYIKNTFKQIDPKWRATSGLSSGEGLIWQVRDEIKKSEAVREKGRVTGEYQEFVIDPGVEDKRLFVIEEEFASTLRLIGRDGNILSPIIRRAWDDGNLESLAKNSPAKATGAHISIIGHITGGELRRYLDRTEIGNGFANRFIWFCSERSKTLPDGGRFYDLNLEPILRKLREAIDFGKTVGELQRDSGAKKIWSEIYPKLSEGKPGLFGAVISRAEAQVMRIACIYAVLDKSETIRKEHLLAAIAIWDYSEASARYIFGDATGDLVADRILQTMRGSTPGLTRTEIRDLFFRNVSGERIDTALSFLESHNLIRMAKQDTGGRPIERWVALYKTTTKTI